MVTRFFWAIMLTGGLCIAEPLTNAASLVGIPLGASEIFRLPSCDATSPDTVFLGTIKALQTGNLQHLYFHFETNYLFSLTGYSNSQGIPDETIASFQSSMSDANFSNMVITTYSLTTSNQFLRVASSLQEHYISRTITEPLTITLRQCTTGWKIVSYDDDKWDE